MEIKVYESRSEEETEGIGREVAKELRSGDFVAFFGELGSGKTAFVRGAASLMCPGARVSSPTYAIVNEYRGALPIFHFDVYRILDDDSLYSTGFYEYAEREGVIFTEWSENIAFALPEKRYEVIFEKTGETARRITVKKIF